MTDEQEDEFKVVVHHNHDPLPGDVGLVLRKGDIITVVTHDDTGWAYGHLGENEGWFPFSFVKRLATLPTPPLSSPTSAPSTPSYGSPTSPTQSPPPEPSTLAASTSSLASSGNLSASVSSVEGEYIPVEQTPASPILYATPDALTTTIVTTTTVTTAITTPVDITPPIAPPKPLPTPIPRAVSTPVTQPLPPPHPISVLTRKSAGPPPRPKSRPPSKLPPLLPTTPSPPTVSNVPTPVPKPAVAKELKQAQIPPLPPKPSVLHLSSENVAVPNSKSTHAHKPSANSQGSTSTSTAKPPHRATAHMTLSADVVTRQQSIADAAAMIAKSGLKRAGTVAIPGTSTRTSENGTANGKANGKPEHPPRPATEVVHHPTGLVHSASAVGLSSAARPLVATPAPQILVRSASAPQNNLPRILRDTSRTKVRQEKHFKPISKEMSLKMAALMDDISLYFQNSKVSDEVEHFKSVYFTTADEFASEMSDTISPLDVAYADCTNDPIPEKFPTRTSVMFHFPNGVEKSISVNSTLTVVEVIREAYRYTHVSFLPKDLQANDCLARLCGRSEYLHESLQLHQVKLIRENMKRNLTVHVALVARTEQLSAALARARKPVPLRVASNSQLSFFADCHHITAAEMENAISHEHFKIPLEIRILSCEGLNTTNPLYAQLFRPEATNTYIFVEASLYCGGSLLAPMQTTVPVIFSQNIEWDEYLTFNYFFVSDLPRGARLCLSLIAKKGTTETPLGWANIQLMDFRGYFKPGVSFTKLWPNARTNPISTCSENYAPDAPTICFEFSNFLPNTQPIVYLPSVDFDPSTLVEHPIPDQSNMDELARIVMTDSLYELSPTETTLVWNYREYLRTTYPHSLPKVLLAAGWTVPHRMRQAISLLSTWPPLDAHDALELLGSKFPDSNIRDFAVSCLAGFDDEELSLYLLQLVQSLKYEPYLVSPLTSFLLERGLRDRLGIGHQLFWFCKTELSQKETALKYGLLLATYLRATEEHTEVLLAQQDLLNKLTNITQQIKEEPSVPRRLKRLGEFLSSAVFLSPTRQLPHQPTISIKAAVVEKCKIMDSAKLPMWAVFENADPLGQPAAFLFKTNDDMRQDVLVLQMLRIMDNLWSKEGLDLHLTCYGCVTTGEKIGMLEAVPNSDTIAHIQAEAGGATAAFKQTPLMNWLKESHTEEEFEMVVENFTRSCAGYVVGTFVLGIGDRHNDNIMLARSGHLFHIDFGHFLGKIKYWAGIKRERAPFIFTPDFAYVMGGKDSPTFARFVSLCCRSYNILRRHSHLFINLFAMMLSTSIPELQTPEDITYLRRAFMMDLDDTQATAAFTAMIYESLAAKSTQVNWAVHILAHQYLKLN